MGKHPSPSFGQRRPLISIVIPVYNGEQYIKATLNSILQQDYQDFELIVIDDGSSDDSISIIQSFNDSRVRLITEQNQGICKARNNGIRAAKADYIMFCDHDDEYELGYLSDAAAEIEASDADMIKFGCIERYICNGEMYREHTISLPAREYEKNQVREFLYLYTNDNEYIWDGVYRKTLIEECGMFDPFYKAGCEDIDLLIKMASKANRIKSVNKIEYIHNIRNDFSTSRKFAEITYQSVIRMTAMRLESVDMKSPEYPQYVYNKNLMMVWALLGMFSFQTCHLSRKEMVARFKNAAQKVPFMKTKRGCISTKSIVMWLYAKKQYGILADICLLKRRLGK